MSFFTSFWGCAETGGVAREGESLNKSSIPGADCGLLSTALVESVFSTIDDSPAAANFDKGQVNNNHGQSQLSLTNLKEQEAH